jgi:hypothetical protein
MEFFKVTNHGFIRLGIVHAAISNGKYEVVFHAVGSLYDASSDFVIADLCVLPI